MPELNPQSSSTETPAVSADRVAAPALPAARDPQRVQVMCPAEIPAFAADAMKGRKPLVAVISYSKP